MKRFTLLISIVLLFIIGCSSEGASNSEETKNLKPVTFVLDWTPNTNHTGIYVAQSEGFFEEEGLDVEIIMPGEAGAGQLVATGKADLGINYQEGLMMARDQDLPLVSVGAVIQHNTAGYASPVEKNIVDPVDFEGKVYGASMSDLAKAIMKTSMEENGADFSKVKSTNIGESDFFVAVERDIDFSLVFQGWTGIEAEIRGQELNMIYLKDLADGLDFYTPIIATSEKMISEDPETVEKFMRAAVKGYEFVIEKPEEAADVLIESVPDLDAELVKESQKWLATKYQDDAPEFGLQEVERWESVKDFMVEHDLIDPAFDVNEAFTNEFITE